MIERVRAAWRMLRGLPLDEPYGPFTVSVVPIRGGAAMTIEAEHMQVVLMLPRVQVALLANTLITASTDETDDEETIQ